MNHEQLLASDPEYSVWLSASAGTGKTKTLIDRIMKLLLFGVDIEKILCITFTNAAANELLERVTHRIYSLASSKNLQDELFELFGCKPNNQIIGRAKSLFNQYVQSDKVLRTYTIHAFCQKILTQFPFEAGLRMNFEIIDPAYLSDITRSIIEQMAKEKPYNLLKYSINLESIAHSLITNADKFERLGELKDCEQMIRRAICCDYTKDDAINYFACASGCKQSEAIELLDQMKQQLFTLAGTPRKNANQDMLGIVVKADEMIKSLNILELSMDLIDFGQSFVLHYKKYKQKNNLIDYHDMIRHTKSLLTNSEFRDWILYKIDGKIGHILIDEAQDTSLEQWDLINVLLENFIAGDKEDMTVFVVGDEKQSIYSFQGASYDAFMKAKSHILQQIASAQRKYRVVNLSTSYRSQQAILDAVSRTFRFVVKNKMGGFMDSGLDLICTKLDGFGVFEILPIERNAQNLATKIAQYIKGLIDGGLAAPEEIMILVRHRNAFNNYIIQYLNNLNIPNAGLDKISVFENIAVQDLLSAALFNINPEDNFALACLLKSPIFGLTNSQLRNLISNEPLVHSALRSEYLNDQLKQKLATILSLKCNAADFFFHILNGSIGAKKLLIANSAENADALQEFISIVLGSKLINNLGKFTQWCKQHEVQFKRSVNSAGVRIMTAHSAKGLQSPVVIIVDNSAALHKSEKLLWLNDLPIWCPTKSMANSVCRQIVQVNKEHDFCEYLRLMYVAMTRAERLLSVWGYGNLSGQSWYGIISAANPRDICSFK